MRSEFVCITPNALLPENYTLVFCLTLGVDWITFNNYSAIIVVMAFNHIAPHTVTGSKPTRTRWNCRQTKERPNMM